MQTWEQSPLDPDAARAARDEGIERIEEVRARETAYLRGLIMRLLSRYQRVNADHLRIASYREGVKITHENCVGAAFTQLAAQQRIVCVDHVKSRAKAARGRTIKVWALTEREQAHGKADEPQ